jgi:DNA-binding FadR family transcriptional regulator
MLREDDSKAADAMTDAAERLRALPPRPIRRGALKVPKTAEVIAQWLRREMRETPMKPGDPLPSETELRARFAVSRATVREALRLLESQQLVRIARGATGGARYSLPDIGMVADHTGIYLEAHGATQHDFTEARLDLEPCMIGFIAERAESEQIERLSASVAAQKAVKTDIVRFSREHEHFYEILADICPNKTLSMFLLIFRELIGAQTNLVGDEIVARGAGFEKALAAHIRAKEKLIELLGARDRDGAERWWRKHLEAQLTDLKAAGRSDMLLKAI